jgi:hypothetical protein
MEFKKALQTVDSNFEDILRILKLKHIPEEVDSARNILLTVNLIIDYYTNRDDDSLKLAVAYFPICEEYFQGLCEEFVCVKLGLYSSQDWKSVVCNKLSKKEINMPVGLTTKNQRALAIEHHRTEKQISRILEASINEYCDAGRTLIYSEALAKNLKEHVDYRKSYNRKTINSFWYLSHAICRFDEFKSSQCPLVLTPDDNGALYETIMEDEGKHPIENIVLFPMKTADGRYSEYCSESFQKVYLERFVKLGAGLRNVFLFSFSHKPYKLRRLFDVKNRMEERLQVTDADQIDFISFTYDEALQLVNKKDYSHLTLSLGKEAGGIQEDYESLVNEITSRLDRYVSRLNEMSLCISQSAIENCSKRLVEEAEADDVIVNQIFNENKSLWNEHAETIMRHFVFQRDVFVVTGDGISDEVKDGFKELLITQYAAKKVRLGTFGDLRGHQVAGQYRNDIKFKRIIVMSFRNDYTEAIFHKYPNSFDPFCVNPDQELLDISNYFFMRPYYEWGLYKYAKALKKILKSDFRSTEMRPVLTEYKRPEKKLLEDMREEDVDRNVSRNKTQVVITYEDDSKHSFWRSELMLYKEKGNERLAPLSDFCGLHDTYCDLQIQPLSSLVKYVRNRVDAKKEQNNRSERMFKEQAVYGLSSKEIKSNVQLWKILLEKRIKERSAKTVYEEVMSHFNEQYKVSFHSFKRWIEPDYGIPRARKMQKYLVENYLDIKPPYIHLIRKIKEQTKNDTESINMSIRHFLNLALLENDFEKVYKQLNEEMKDLLDISKKDDIKDLISDVRTKIKFESIKGIEL